MGAFMPIIICGWRICGPNEILGVLIVHAIKIQLGVQCERCIQSRHRFSDFIHTMQWLLLLLLLFIYFAE